MVKGRAGDAAQVRHVHETDQPVRGERGPLRPRAAVASAPTHFRVTCIAPPASLSSGRLDQRRNLAAASSAGCSTHRRRRDAAAPGIQTARPDRERPRTSTQRFTGTLPMGPPTTGGSINVVGWRFQSLRINGLEMVAQICPRWNPLTSWMRQIADFQTAA